MKSADLGNGDDPATWRGFESVEPGAGRVPVRQLTEDVHSPSRTARLPSFSPTPDHGGVAPNVLDHRIGRAELATTDRLDNGSRENRARQAMVRVSSWPSCADPREELIVNDNGRG
jgi:hypothetical protein